MKSVQTLLYAELKDAGFHRKGKNLFFVQMNDVIGLVAVEKPTGYIYVQFAVVPLFLPCPGSIYYTYGRRLRDMYHDLPAVDSNSTEEQLNRFCKTAAQHIRQDLLPLLQALSTSTALRTYAEKQGKLFGKRGPQVFYCTSEEMKYLHMYCCLYDRDYEEAMRAARKYALCVRKTKYWTEALKAKKIRESDQIIEMIHSASYQQIESMFERNRAENLSLFFGSGAEETASRDPNQKSQGAR